jgi:hypothetical protein
VFRKLVARFVVLAAGGLTLAAAPALAASSPVTADCNAHGQLTKQYSVAELRTALATMPADVQEYTDCYDVIQRQLLAQVSGHRTADASGSSSGGSSFLPTPLLIVLIVVVLGGGAVAGVALQRRGDPPGGS